MASASVELQTPAAQVAGARSAVYRALGRAFRAPAGGSAQAVDAAEIAEEVRQAAAFLPYALNGVADLADADVSQDVLERTYLALFETGGEYGAPRFLYEGEYGGGRMKVLEDALRFYNYFGLHLDQERRERPDHLATECEFLHALTFREAVALNDGSPVEALRRAERDFLRLHLVEFVSTLSARLAGSGAPFYPALAACAASFCQSELAFLEAGG